MRRLSTLILLILLTSAVHSQGWESYKKLCDTSILSEYLGYEKDFTVIVPKEFRYGQRTNYPLIIVYDRQNEVNFNYMIQTMDYLTAFGQMPACVIIGVSSDNTKRISETQLKTSAANGLGEKNDRFIFKELIPLARDFYACNSFKLLIGHSRYGYFSTYQLYKHFDELNGVISISPFFTQKNVNLVDSIANSLSTYPTMPHQVYYQFATGDSVEDTRDYSLMHDRLNKVRKPDYFHFKGYEFYRSSHFTTPGLAVGQSLYTLFSEWANQSMRFYHDTASTTSDYTKYAGAMNTVRLTYKERIPFSIGVFNGKGWQFYNKGKYEQAIDAWKLLAEVYPDYSESYLFIAMAQKELKFPFENALQYFLLNLEKSPFYSAAEKEELKKEGLQLRE
jgi:predicted alpha/beta superfamily hydrolase